MLKALAILVVILSVEGAIAQDGPLFTLSELISEDDKFKELVFSKEKYMGPTKIVRTRYRRGIARYSKDIESGKVERILLHLKENRDRYWPQKNEYFITHYNRRGNNVYLIIYPGFGLCFSGFYEDELYLLVEEKDGTISFVERGSTSGMEC